MIQHEPEVCPFCTKVFVPYPQVGARQIACENWNCKRQRIKRTKKLWHENNPTCNYDYVKKFRCSHPDYQKQWRQQKKRRSRLSEDTTSHPLEAKLGSSLSIKAGPSIAGGRSLSVVDEIRNKLSITKTTTELDLFGTGEIRNQLNICITLPLTELLVFCTQSPSSEIRNQSSA
jgi:hypothetical protein